MRTYEHDARVAEHNDRIACALARPAGCVAPARVGAGMGAVRPRLRTMTRLVSAASWPPSPPSERASNPVARRSHRRS